jgi:DNA-binding NarL/FixJ family response regulator
LPMNRIRVLLVSPNLLLRDGIAGMFREHPEFEIVGSSGEKETATAKAYHFKPNILLLDISLDYSNSRFLIEIIREQLSGTKACVFGVAAGEDTLLDFVKLGVAGFIIGDASFEVFCETLKLISRGMTVLPPSLNDSLFRQIEKHAIVGSKFEVSNSIRITKREQEIIRLIKKGMANKEIASELKIATYTVKSHIHHILDKLSLHSRTQIATGAKTKEPFKIEPN